MKPCCRSKARRLAGWLPPGCVLLLMPKCPACFAGYVAIFAGAGLSLPAAAALRTVLIGGCLCWMIFLLCGRGRKKAGGMGARPCHPESRAAFVIPKKPRSS